MYVLMSGKSRPGVPSVLTSPTTISSPVGGGSSGNAADVLVPSGSVDATVSSGSDVGAASVVGGSVPSTPSVSGAAVSGGTVTSALSALVSSGVAASSSLLQASAPTDMASTPVH